MIYLVIESLKRNINPIMLYKRKHFFTLLHFHKFIKVWYLHISLISYIIILASAIWTKSEQLWTNDFNENEYGLHQMKDHCQILPNSNIFYLFNIFETHSEVSFPKIIYPKCEKRKLKKIIIYIYLKYSNK